MAMQMDPSNHRYWLLSQELEKLVETPTDTNPESYEGSPSKQEQPLAQHCPFLFFSAAASQLDVPAGKVNAETTLISSHPVEINSTKLVKQALF